ncbi:NAD(P)/FAD-dependent oxidoreductase [Fulvivirgaceae bacterium BMA12]|uniref:NADH:ubiquinone reductase (non-electrogenic) n=1 Tax=Agaribacillus aureus TaxID=3051825 RepID=A0ABT8LFI7_9BACT|nr:NAD(P)/FAD-dependent oxidoreductase [Fulvivirgaceae bacterium BMA12]
MNYSIHIPSSTKKRVVIIGGGFGGIRLAKGLKNKGFQVVMLDRHNYHTFQPLLYQVATAGLEPDSIAGPLRKLLKHYKDFYFRMALVNRIVPEENMIDTTIGQLKYDYLVIAAGSKTNYFGQEKNFEKAFPLKQIPQALDLRSQILQNFEKAIMTHDKEERQSLMNFVIVGGGPTGVEVAGALGELKMHVLPNDYKELDFEKMSIYLIEAMPRLLNGMSDSAGEKSYDFLKRFNVTTKLGTMVKAFDGKSVQLDDGMVIPSQTLIWAAGVTGNLIDGLPDKVIANGRIMVDEFSKVNGYDNVFAIGDIAMQQTESYPKGHPMLAQVAMQQGSLLAKNLLRINKDKALIPFNYSDKGSMATIGRNKAVVDLKSVKFSGLFAWFVWMFIHLISIIGFRNKLVVFSNWLWNYFTYDRGTRLIIRPFVRKPKKKKQEEKVPVA